MEENNIEKLPSEYREYVKDNIGVPKIIRGQQLFYYENTCHVNSILFSEFINTTTQYHCSVIEGIVVCKNGFAYEHCWNLIRDENGEAEYVDVTMEAIATDTERETEKVYYELKEYEIEELIEKIKYGQPLFTQETHHAVDEYYVEHPEKEAEYRTGKLKVDR